MRRRQEAAGGERDGDAERGRFLGIREAGLAVSCAHFLPAVSQSVGLWPRASTPMALHGQVVDSSLFWLSRVV